MHVSPSQAAHPFLEQLKREVPFVKHVLHASLSVCLWETAAMVNKENILGVRTPPIVGIELRKSCLWPLWHLIGLLSKY